MKTGVYKNNSPSVTGPQLHIPWRNKNILRVGATYARGAKIY